MKKIYIIVAIAFIAIICVSYYAQQHPIDQMSADSTVVAK